MSGLGDLLWAHLKPEKQAEKDQEANDVEDQRNVPPPKVFPERVEKKLDDDDRQSNASSTDDYVRELLDPNDRPRNVWHVVEGPKASESCDEDKTQASEYEASSQLQDKYDMDDTVDSHVDISMTGKTDDDSQYPTESNQGDETREPIQDKIPLHSEMDAQQQSSRHRHDRDSDRDRGGRDRDRGHDSDRRRDRDRDRHRHRDRDYGHRDRDRESRDRDSRSHRSESRHKSSTRHSHDRSDGETDRRSDYSRRRSDIDRDRHRRSRSRSKGSSSRKSRRERSRSDSQSPLTKRNSRTILIMKLNPKVTSRDLEDFFSNLGRVREVRLIMDTKTRRHKGLAYIEFEDSATAKKAFALNGETFFDAPIVIQSAQTGDRSSNENCHSSSSTYQTTRSSSSSHQHHSHHHSSSRSHHSLNSYRIYVGGLHVNITEEMLKSLFEPFGPILRLELMRDRITNASRGYAFITYADIEDGQSAVLALDGLELGGKAIKVSKSTDKNERQSSSTVTDSSTRTAPTSGHYDDDTDSQTSKLRDVTTSLYELAGH